jgi:17 kDa common-antigen outer membrane protein
MTPQHSNSPPAPYSSPRCRIVAAAILIGAIFPAMAQNSMGFLKDAPVASFTPQDFDLMQAAAADVLSRSDKGASKTFHNDATGNGGTIKLLGSFKSTEGRDCKRLQLDTSTQTLTATSKVKVCHFPDGRWLIDAQAKPQPAPAAAQPAP